MSTQPSPPLSAPTQVATSVHMPASDVTGAVPAKPPSVEKNASELARLKSDLKEILVQLVNEVGSQGGMQIPKTVARLNQWIASLSN